MGVDVVELTGNHLLDYGPSDFLTTIDMYDQRGWLHYGGGRNLAEALKPALIVHNGNKLAFVGCNLSGPKTDWATDASPGAAPCNMDQMHAEIQLLRSQGYIPIMTFQYDEYYTYTPTEYEQRDFRGMADAGAVIVSGSQSHMTAAPEFYGNSFIHYGLGNLFFDQMVHIMPDGSVSQITRNEFIDRHVFYDGRYIGTELLTYILEHYSRPRPMTEYERTQLLEAIFHAAGW
jgi:poly-gamma-glutamate synthesis protein (capsule biosynthesis protein)